LTCVRESHKYRQKWLPQSILTFSMERQTLQKHFWTWSIFERPSAWWLILCATDVPYTDIYNTRPRLKFTAYSLGGPYAPSFCARAPKCQKSRFRSQIGGFLWTNCYAQSVSFHRPCAECTIHRRKLGAPYWGSRRCPRRLRPRRVSQSVHCLASYGISNIFQHGGRPPFWIKKIIFDHVTVIEVLIWCFLQNFIKIGSRVRPPDAHNCRMFNAPLLGNGGQRRWPWQPHQGGHVGNVIGCDHPGFIQIGLLIGEL